MEIPQEVMDHMEDDIMPMDVAYLGHLLQLHGHTITIFARGYYPEMKHGDKLMALTDAQVVELNEVLAKVTAEYAKWQPCVWLREVVYTVSSDGESHIGVPDAYDHIMEELQHIMATHPHMRGGHSNIKKARTLN